MRPPSHPKVVPWDQLFFLLKSPLYIVDFRHMNRGHFPNKAKSGKPAAHPFRTNKIRFWGTFRYISAKMINCGPLGKRRPGLLFSHSTRLAVKKSTCVCIPILFHLPRAERIPHLQTSFTYGTADASGIF